MKYPMGGAKHAIPSTHPTGDRGMGEGASQQPRPREGIISLRNGFCIGYNYKENTCWPCGKNMASAALHPQVVEEYLSKECSAGRIVGPLPLQEFSFVQISPFGVIPKSTPRKWRLVLDLSSPHGKSVKDGIDKRLCSLTYTKVDEVANYVLQNGRGTLLAKLTSRRHTGLSQSTHAQDQVLLGMRWDEQLYVNTAHPAQPPRFVMC